MFNLTSNKDGYRRLLNSECSDSTGATEEWGIVLARGQGSSLWDVEGNEYVDLCGGFGSLSLGQNPDSILNVFSEYASRKDLLLQGMGDVFPSADKIQFIEKLSSVLPARFKRVSLALSGSGAVDIALKTAFQRKASTGMICFEGGYHGLELGVLPIAAREDFREPFVSWFNNSSVVRLPWACSDQDIENAVYELQKNGTPLAAVIVEPIQGRGGMRPAPKSWLSMLYDVTQREDALLIFDEVFVGAGRTGRFTWASEFDCDLICLGKALGGGVPIAVCAGTEAAMDHWPKDKPEAIHTGTYFGHPFSCRIASVVVDEIVRNNLSGRSLVLGDKIQKLLAQELKSPLVREVRATGLFVGIEFTKAGLGEKVMIEGLKKKIITLPCGDGARVLSLTPALNIDEGVLFSAVRELALVINSI
ncbi:MAG: aminotransferase class III-fold pyridoxal phosphate-dependent enzyme [Oligoflexales bacterium]